MDENLNDASYTAVPPVTPTYPPPATPPYPSAATPPYTAAAMPPYAPAATSGLSDNNAAAIAYLTFIPAVVFLVMEPYNRNPFIKFHAFQSIGLAVVSVVVCVVQMVLMFIPILGLLINLALFLCLLAAWLISIIKASKGEWFKLPIIGDFAMKQAKS